MNPVDNWSPVPYLLEFSDILSLIGVIGTALIGLWASIYVQRSTKKLREEEAEKAERRLVERNADAVEAQAYSRARESYEAAIRRYASEVANLTIRIGACEEATSAANRRASQANDRADRADRRMRQLENILRDHNIPVPPAPEE